jgi:hypothetical protein
MWHLTEPIHAVLYYAPEVFAAAEALGFATATRWPSYFAWRAAPLGAAGRHQVAAAFYSFSPHMVGDHVPDAWRVAAPEQILAARYSAMDAAMRSLLGAAIDDPGLEEAAGLARRAAGVAAANSAGRPMAAANADLTWPAPPHLVVWQAVTILREHRGDGHVAALLTHGLDPTEALVSFAAIGAAPASVFESRGWTSDEWQAAAGRLRQRGLIDADGVATAAGRDLRATVEQVTDDLAAAPWAALGPNVGRFAQLIAPITERIVASGLLPAQSTLGIRR